MSRWVRAARAWHAVTAIVTGVALVLQLGLVLIGVSPLLPEDRPSRALAVLRFFAYFTIQSNVLVLIISTTLARRPDRDGPVWGVLRADAVVGITVTGLVHWFLLRPLLSLSGASQVADQLLHLAVPLLALTGWLIFGPRPRVTLRTLGWALLWPVVWTVVIIVQGWFSRWFPYPFLNVHTLGVRVIPYVLAITLLFLALGALLRFGDRHLPGRNRP